MGYIPEVVLRTRKWRATTGDWSMKIKLRYVGLEAKTTNRAATAKMRWRRFRVDTSYGLAGERSGGVT